MANVCKKSDNSFVYSIHLNENKKIEASPSLSSLLRASNRTLNASNKSIRSNSIDVNPKIKNSIKKQERNYNNPSLKDLGLDRELKAENKKLRGDVEQLRELLSLQNKLTHGKKFTHTSVLSAASVLMNRFDMTKGKVDLARHLESFYEYIAGADHLTWDSITDEAMKVVKWINTSHPRKFVRDSHAQEVLNRIRSTKIKFNDTQKTEAANIYGSYKMLI